MTLNDADISPLSRTQPSMLSWKDDVDEIGRTTILLQDFSETSPMNWIEDFDVIYEDHIEILVLFHAVFLKLSGSEDHVPLPARRPYWLSDNTFWRWACVDNRLTRIRARIFPAMESSYIPQWSSHHARIPFFLTMWTIMTSLKSCGTASLSQILRNSLDNIIENYCLI